jgi:hypothetical protein
MSLMCVCRAVCAVCAVSGVAFSLEECCSQLAQGGPGTIEGVTERMMAQLGTAVATLHTLSPVDNLPPFPMG